MGAGLVVAVPAHVDLAEVDDPGVVGQAVHDRVRRDPVGHVGDPVRWPGLRDDHRREPVFAVGEDREQVAGGVAVDADGEEVVDDEKLDVGELVQQFLVGDAVAASDDEPVTVSLYAAASASASDLNRLTPRRNQSPRHAKQASTFSRSSPSCPPASQILH